MDLQIFKQEFTQMFKWFTSENSPASAVNLEFDLDNKLATFFLAGKTYYFVFNHHTLRCDIVSKEVEEVIGYTPNEFNPYLMNEEIHPDDLSYFLALGSKTSEFFSQLPIEKARKYKLSYDIRYRKKNSGYIRILYQGIWLEHDNEGKLLRSLGLHTDITHLKKEGKPSLSFIGIEGEPSYTDVDFDDHLLHDKDGFTSREKDILKLLIEGKLSKQIGSILHITKQTVDTHRKNMLHKKHLVNTSELVSKAILHGWV